MVKSRSICVVLAIIVLGWLYFVPPSYEPLGYDKELSCAPLAFDHSGHGKGDEPDSDLVERRYRKYYGSSGSSDVDRDDDLKKEADSVVEDWKEGCRLVREDRQALLNMASVLFATIFLSLSISQLKAKLPAESSRDGAGAEPRDGADGVASAAPQTAAKRAGAGAGRSGFVSAEADPRGLADVGSSPRTSKPEPSKTPLNGTGPSKASGEKGAPASDRGGQSPDGAQ